MVVTDKLEMVRSNGVLKITFEGVEITPKAEELNAWERLYNTCRLNKCDRDIIFNDFLSSNQITLETNGIEDVETVELSAEEKLERGLSNLIKFFKEFEFEPNFRFTNTLSFKANESDKSVKDYIGNYFDLMDNSYTNEVKAKIKSREFEKIISDISAIGTPKSSVNNRFKIYYGSAGTGKTTLAQKESNGKCIVCNSSMLPSDLMEDFVFVSGQPSFKPSSLWECMTNGTPIVLDEINLLPFDSLRFLQGILDGKAEFDYKGNKVQIADGFQIIGTMNLTIGGMTYGLPEPLVDRASDMKKFSLTAKQLAKSIMG